MPSREHKDHFDGDGPLSLPDFLLRTAVFDVPSRLHPAQGHPGDAHEHNGLHRNPHRGVDRVSAVRYVRNLRGSMAVRSVLGYHTERLSSRVPDCGARQVWQKWISCSYYFID